MTFPLVRPRGLVPLIILCFLGPLTLFVALAEEVREREPFGWDSDTIAFLQQWAPATDTKGFASSAGGATHSSGPLRSAVGRLSAGSSRTCSSRPGSPRTERATRFPAEPRGRRWQSSPGSPFSRRRFGCGWCFSVVAGCLIRERRWSTPAGTTLPTYWRGGRSRWPG